MIIGISNEKDREREREKMREDCMHARTHANTSMLRFINSKSSQFDMAAVSQAKHQSSNIIQIHTVTIE